MKRLLRVVARAGLIALLGAAAASCSKAREPHSGDGSDSVIARVGSGTEPVADAGSLFELTFPLRDQDGREARIADLRGRPFVATMVYTSCQSVCPRVTADLLSLEKALPERDRARLRFVMFSLDPERDDPQALRAFAASHSLDLGRWILYASSVDDMRTLAAALGVRHRPDLGGEIAHSAVIVVVDRDGVVRHRQVGVQDDLEPLVAAVSAVR